MTVTGAGDAVYEYLRGTVLEPGEKVVWTGRPSIWASSSRGIPALLFGSLFFGFSVFWVYGASRAGGWFWMFGLLFVLAGFAILTSPFQMAFLATRTYYAITDRRIIVITNFFGRRVRSYYAPDITDFEVIDTGSGRGSIKLRTNQFHTGRGRQSFQLGTLQGGLWGIDGLLNASRAIMRLKQAV